MIALVAAAAVTYMIVWMRRHARNLRGDLQTAVSGRARAWLRPRARRDGVLRGDPRGARDGRVPHCRVPAVGPTGADRQRRDPRRRRCGRARRSGSTAAASRSTSFASSGSPASCSCSSPAASSSPRCTRATTAGWIVSLQGEAVDLTWLAPPGSIRASLLTGVLGLQPTLTTGEALAWLVYVVPMTLLRALARPPARGRHARLLSRAARREGRCTRASLTRRTSQRQAAAAHRRRRGTTPDDDKNGAKSMLVRDSPTPAATRARPRPRPGSSPSRSRTRAQPAVTELEVIKDKRILGEVENLADGLNGEFSLTLQPGDYELYCPNGTTQERGTLTVTGETVASDECGRRAKAIAAYKAYVIGQAAMLETANDGVHGRGPGRRRREGQEAVPDRARAVRADRAGRRVVRRPRPRDRRARRRRAGRDVDGLPQAREDALGRQRDRSRR